MNYSSVSKLKSNRIVYQVGHGLNLLKIRLSVIPYAFKYILADRKLKVIKNNPNTDEKFLIFQRVDYTGLMTHMLAVLGWVKYAEENGYTLVVDTSRGENKYRENSNENTWELFYQQPMLDCTANVDYIEQLLTNDNYSYVPESTRHGLSFVHYVPRWIVKKLKPKTTFPRTTDIVRDPDTQKYWEGMYKKYIKLQPEVQRYVEQEYNEIIAKSGKVLGVLIRGAGYRDVKPFMHDIQPEMEDVIEKINEFQEEYGWDYIYLATEEEKYEKQLKDLYPGKILTNKREYDEENSERPGHQAGLEYLSSMYLLSRCDMLIAGLCGGSQAAILMNQHQYSHLYVFDIGKYQ